MRPPKLAATVLVLGCSVCAGACGYKAEAAIDRPSDGTSSAWVLSGDEVTLPEGSPLRARIAVAPVAMRSVRHELGVPASVEGDPAKMAKISPPLPGRVVKLMVRLGASVKRGAPLFTLSSAELVAAQTDYLKACSADGQADRSLMRQRALAAHGIGAQRDLEQAETDRQIAGDELKRSLTRLRLLGIDPGQLGKPLTVRSPVSGRVIELATTTGQMHNDAAVVLMTVADLSTVWVSADVPEKDLPRVSVGDEAAIDFAAHPGHPFTGRVGFIGEMVAPETRSAKVRIELDNPDGALRPGMFARVRLRGSALPEVLVPATALLVRGDRSFLFVERRPWVFERRPVEVGDTLPEGTCIQRGLQAGERIVTANTIVLP